jgi:phosphomannomutase
LEKEPGAKIVHDPRVVWNTRETVLSKSGDPIVSKTGHAFIKATMRENDAIYGGEMSAHHYFRDFAYCDSGMIPWLLIWELISKTEKSLGALLKECREKFPSSGEQNFKVSDATHCLSVAKAQYHDSAESVDELDGVSIEFKDWRFNLRKSNTEPLVRLNVETRGNKDLLGQKALELIHLIKGT